jgi:hypothetical protein
MRSILSEMMHFPDEMVEKQQRAQLQAAQQPNARRGEIDITSNPVIREIVEAYARRFPNEKVRGGIVVEGKIPGDRVANTDEDGKIILDPEWRRWKPHELDRIFAHELKHRADYAEIPLNKYDAHDAMPEEEQPYELIAEHRGVQFASERAGFLVPPYKGYIGVPPVRWP